MLRVLTLAIAVTSGTYAYQLCAGTSVARAGSAVKRAPAARLPGRMGPACMAAPAAEIAMPTSHAEGGGDSRPKKIFVLGGDGFCGWPTALHLSDKGHKGVIFDNLDLANEYDRFVQMLRNEKPDTMVHFAEQRA